MLARIGLVIALVSMAIPAHAQFPAPADLPNLELSQSGKLYATALQADGKVLIGGDFLSINGTPSKNIARLNPDGSLDPTWTGTSDGLVIALEISGDSVFIGGPFENVNGTARRYAAKLSLADGALDAAWDPSPDNFAVAFAFDGSWVYIGGWYENIGGQAITGLARADRDSGAIDATWDAGFDDRVYAVEVDGSHAFVSGEFLNAGGSPRARLAKISLGDASVDEWNPGADEYSVRLLIHDGQVYAAGLFGQIGGVSRNRIARIDATTGVVDPDWNPNADDRVNDIVLVGDHLYACGVFNAIGGRFTENIAKIPLSGDGDADPGFATEADNSVLAIAADGSELYVVGIFQEIGGSAAFGAAKLDPLSGSTDQSFVAEITSPGEIDAIARQNDGKILVGGTFDHAGLLKRHNLARFSADGSLDTKWAPDPDGSIQTIAVNGTDIYVGGIFSSIGGEQRFNAAKLSSTGTDAADPDWNPQAGGRVYDIEVGTDAVYLAGDFTFAGGNFRVGLVKVDSEQGFAEPGFNPMISSDGNTAVYTLALDGPDLYVGGEFNMIGNFVPQARNNIAKLTTSTAEVLFWNPAPDANAVIAKIDVTDDGVYVAGFFNNIGGQSRANLARLRKSNAFADLTWNPQVSDEVHELLATDDAVYIGGFFTQVGGQPRNAVAKILRSGQVDPDWNPDPNGGVEALAVSGTYVYAGGFFSEIGGADRNGFALLPIPDAPALVQDSANSLRILRHSGDGDEITHFQIISVSGGDLIKPGGERVAAGGFISVAEGETGFTLPPGSTIEAASAVRPEPGAVGNARSSLTMGANPSAPVFRLGLAQTTVNEGTALLVLDIEKIAGGAGSVNYAVREQTALLGADFGFPSGSGTLSFSSEEGSKQISIAIVDEFLPEGDETFLFELSASPEGGAIAYPGTLTATIIDNDIVGSAASAITVVPPDPILPAPANGSVLVNLSGDANLGGWRLMGEVDWRDSADDGGAHATGLSTGNYTIEFRPVDDLLQPNTVIIPVDGTDPTPVAVAAAYSAAELFAPGNGTLSATVEPAAVAEATIIDERGQWRRQGESVWRDSGTAVTVPSGLHIVEFKPVSGRITPPARLVAVQADQSNGATGVYLFETDLVGATIPTPLPFEPPSPGDPAATAEPYHFNGQIFTEQGYGSGVVTKEHTVLTAAHVLFDDTTLTHVKDVLWFHSRHRGDFDLAPVRPRGWYRFDGYAAQRESDVANPAFGPGVGSPASQELDAAALYFLAPAGRGGSGGYLASDDQANNPWLISNRDKFLVGYPMEGVDPTLRGRMHATPIDSSPYEHRQGFVFKTDGFKTAPGNSGGPVYARADNGGFYPAAIYLGGTGESVVRAIDSAVVDLMNRAETAGAGGGNSTGGGATFTSPGATDDFFSRGTITAITPGADEGAWRVIDAGGKALTDFIPAGTLIAIPPGEFRMEFKPLPGLRRPAVKNATVYAAQTTRIEAPYSQTMESWTQDNLVDAGVTIGTGPLDDHDGDSLVHLLERAFNLSPTESDNHGLTPGTGTSGLPAVYLADLGDGERLTVEYIRLKPEVATDLTYSPEFADDLDGGYAASSQSEIVTEIDSVWERAVIQDDFTTAQKPERFARVEIELAP